MTEESTIKKTAIITALLVSVAASAVGIWWIRKRRMCKKEEPIIKKNNTETKTSDNNPALNSIDRASSERSKGNKYFNAGRFEDAIKCYSESINLYPGTHPDLALAYANRAAAYLSTKEYDKALKDCNSALAINPKFIKALDRKSRILDNLGDLEGAMIEAVAAAVLDNFKNETFLIHIEELVKTVSETKAKALIRTRKHELCSKWNICSFLQSFPREWKTIYDRDFDKTSDPLFKFYQLIKDEKYSEAFQEIKALEATGGFKNNASVYNWLGTFYSLSGDFENARLALQESSTLDPYAISSRVKLALVQMELGNYAEMTEALDAALKLDDTDPSIYYHRAEIFALSNNMDQAIADFDRAIQLSPEFVDAYVHRARAQIRMGNLSAAKHYLENALELFNEQPDLLHAYAECLAVENKMDEALKIFEKVEKTAPEFPQVSLNLALIRMHTEKYSPEDFGNALEGIVRRFSNFDAAHMQLASYFVGKGDIEKGLKHYDIAAENARTFQEIVSIYTIRSITYCQFMVSKKYPELSDAIQRLMMMDHQSQPLN